MDLVPDVGDAAKAHLFVVEIIIGRRVLGAAVLEQRFEMAIEMRDGAKPGGGGIAGVEFGDIGLRQMRDGAEPELFGLVDGGAVDFGGFIAAIEEFDAVDAGFRRPAHPFARLFRGLYAAARPAGAEGLIDIEARRADLAGRAAAFVVERMGGIAAEERHAAHRGDAMRQPQAIGIAWVIGLFGVTIMAVHVDESGHDIHAGGIDFAGGAARFTVGAQRQARRAGGPDLGDAIALDDDVGRAIGRAAIAGDDGGAADDQQRIGAVRLACHPCRGGQHRGGSF